MRVIIFSLLAAGLLAATTKKQSSVHKSSVMKFNAGIITGKLKETKEFYTVNLGFAVKFENEWFLLLEAPGSEDMISFMQPGHASQQPLFQPAFAGKGIYFTIEIKDVDAEYKRIKTKGIPVAIELRDEPWGDRHFAIVDPNGIGVDIVTYTPPR
jgi:catechol 2,3-dioxygenase-like lactoylglutathione lyase family enzyme